MDTSKWILSKVRSVLDYNFKDNYFDSTVYSKSEGGYRVVSHDVIMNFELGFIPFFI